MKLKNYTIPHIELHTNILTGYVKKVWNSFRMFIFHKITKNHPQNGSNFSKPVLNSQTLCCSKPCMGRGRHINTA